MPHTSLGLRPLGQRYSALHPVEWVKGGEGGGEGRGQGRGVRRGRGRGERAGEGKSEGEAKEERSEEIGGMGRDIHSSAGSRVMLRERKYLRESLVRGRCQSGGGGGPG